MTATTSSESEQHTDPEPPADRTRDWRDITAVLVMSITAVLTAWCGFEASKWGGEMSIAFSQASSARTQAINYDGVARDSKQWDLTIYAQWVVAESEGNTQLADYIESRFTPELTVAFDAWQTDGMVENGPFVRPEYVPPGTEEAVVWNERADRKFAEALANNQRGDNYSILTVLFALVLFLTALSQRARTEFSARVLLGLAGVAAVAGFVIMLTFPIKI